MYERLLDMNNLYNAFLQSKKSVDWKCSVQRYEANLLSNLYKLRKSLEDETYKQKPFYEFDINERGKNRHIKSLHISDRIVQRALNDYVLMPTIKKYLIYDNGASIKGKGIEFTRNRLCTHLHKYYRQYGNQGYVLLIDYSKFFDSIPHKQLMQIFKEIIDDERVIRLIQQMIESFGNEKSLGIGSQLSQIAGIYYPTKIDNYIKIVKGCKYYGRYMDDLYIISNDKNFLKDLLNEITQISSELGLSINHKKTQICKLDKGFTFLKLYHILTPSGRIVRKPSKDMIVRERRKLKKLRKKLDDKIIQLNSILESYKSWRGNVEKYDSHRSLQSMDRLFLKLYGEEMLCKTESF